jgi:uncharacterized protein with NRDE domain
MCTLVALHRIVRDLPILVAANRDEFYGRAAEGPALRSTPRGRIICPLDRREGGTWLGVNERGVFAAVTNVSSPNPDPERRSRGWLVMEALSAGSADEAAEAISKVTAGAHNPFNLFVADGDSAFAISCVDEPRCVELGPGAHVVGNAPLDGPDTPKLARLRGLAARAAATAPEAVPDELVRICRDHSGVDALGSACVHTEHYGTRSSALLGLAAGGAPGFFRFAHGAPCQTDYDDFTPLLHELGPGSLFVEGAEAARRVS